MHTTQARLADMNARTAVDAWAIEVLGFFFFRLRITGRKGVNHGEMAVLAGG
jgi:hypothetical protein